MEKRIIINSLIRRIIGNIIEKYRSNYGFNVYENWELYRKFYQFCFNGYVKPDYGVHHRIYTYELKLLLKLSGLKYRIENFAPRGGRYGNEFILLSDNRNPFIKKVNDDKMKIFNLINDLGFHSKVKEIYSFKDNLLWIPYFSFSFENEKYEKVMNKLIRSRFVYDINLLSDEVINKINKVYQKITREEKLKSLIENIKED